MFESLHTELVESAEALDRYHGVPLGVESAWPARTALETSGSGTADLPFVSAITAR